MRKSKSIILNNYHSNRSKIKTGDLILFSGNSLISLIIRGFTFSKFSHVGVVYKIEDEDLLLMMESTSINKGFKGVQVVELSRRILTYSGKTYWRPLNKSLSPEMKEKFSLFRKNLLWVKYEKSIVDLILSALGASRRNGTKLSSVFCSELIISLFQEIGLMPKTYEPSSYCPKHLSSKFCLNLIDDYKYLKEIEL